MKRKRTHELFGPDYCLDEIVFGNLPTYISEEELNFLKMPPSYELFGPAYCLDEIVFGNLPTYISEDELKILEVPTSYVSTDDLLEHLKLPNDLRIANSLQMRELTSKFDISSMCEVSENEYDDFIKNKHEPEPLLEYFE
jgi:hypothetical protein